MCLCRRGTLFRLLTWYPLGSTCKASRHRVPPRCPLCPSRTAKHRTAFPSQLPQVASATSVDAMARAGGGSAPSPSRVNGAVSNVRYVEDNMQSVKDYLASSVAPVVEELVTAAAAARPDDVRAFLLERLAGDTDTSSAREPIDAEAARVWTEEHVTPIMRTVVRRLAQERPKDVRAAFRDALGHPE